jgi:hypothetical protein
MNDLRAIADRIEIEVLRSEFTDAAMMRDYDRGASLFTPDAMVRIPHNGVELSGQEEIRVLGEWLRRCWTISCRPPPRRSTAAGHARRPPPVRAVRRVGDGPGSR